MPMLRAYCMALTKEQTRSSSTRFQKDKEDLTLSCRPNWTNVFGTEDEIAPPSALVRPLSRRSGCVPALPYPPLRSVVVYPNEGRAALAGGVKLKNNH
jgi:hypothetical protein